MDTCSVMTGCPPNTLCTIVIPSNWRHCVNNVYYLCIMECKDILCVATWYVTTTSVMCVHWWVFHADNITLPKCRCKISPVFTQISLPVHMATVYSYCIASNDCQSHINAWSHLVIGETALSQKEMPDLKLTPGLLWVHNNNHIYMILLSLLLSFFSQ